MEIIKEQIILVHTLLNKEGFKDKEEKKEAIHRFTYGRTTSTKGLNFKEANKLIVLLKGKPVKDPEEALNKKFGWINKNDAQDFLIVSNLHQLGWLWDENPKLVDVVRLGRFIRYKTKIGKPLSQMNSTEKTKLINHLNAVIKNP